MSVKGVFRGRCRQRFCYFVAMMNSDIAGLCRPSLHVLIAGRLCPEERIQGPETTGMDKETGSLVTFSRFRRLVYFSYCTKLEWR